MDSLLSVVASDTGIFPYQGEAEDLYKSRLIYSSVCEWMRYTTQDSMIEKKYSKSKQYVLNRCSEILKAFLDCEPECKSWFFESDNDSIINTVQTIRQKMIDSGELVEVGEKNYLSVPQYEEIMCALGYARIVGFGTAHQQKNNIGITRVIKVKKGGNRFFNDNHFDIEEYIEWSYKKGQWSDILDLDKFEFFDMTSKKVPSQSWIDQPIKSQERHLGRINLYNGYYEYWLLKYRDGQWYGRVMEEILHIFKEERRILLGLRKQNRNNMWADYEYKRTAIILHLHCRLPKREEILLDTFAWPLNNFNDKINYVISVKIWDSVKELLARDLGIDIKEKL